MEHPSSACIIRLRNQVRAAEKKADESLMAKLELMRAILYARQTEDVPAPHIGQEALVRLSRALQSEVSASNDLFRAHNAMVQAKVQITGGPGHDDTEGFHLSDDSQAA